MEGGKKLNWIGHKSQQFPMPKPTLTLMSIRARFNLFLSIDREIAHLYERFIVKELKKQSATARSDKSVPKVTGTVHKRHVR